MSSPLNQLLVGWCALSLLMLLLWWRQRASLNAGWVDVGWAASVGLLAVWYAVSSDGTPLRRGLVAALTLAWSLRLIVHLAHRLRGAPEDPRYAELREQWGARAQQRFFLLYQLQALVAVMLSLSQLSVTRNPTQAEGWLLLGVLIWVLGWLGETLADRQLERFKQHPGSRGLTCREGLWRYSRHPNYFFEWLQWCAWVPLAVGAPQWWLSLAGPCLMLYLLVFVTGVRPSERQALRSRGEDYRRYQRTTSAFVPWPPKHEATR